MNYIHLYKRIPPDCFLLWWPRLCGKDCEVDSLWNKKTFHISYANTKFFSWLQYLTGAHFCAWLTELTPWVYLWALGGGRALKWREHTAQTKLAGKHWGQVPEKGRENDSKRRQTWRPVFWLRESVFIYYWRKRGKISHTTVKKKIKM